MIHKALLRDEFEALGYAVVPAFYDVERDIDPICEEMRGIVALVAAKYGIAAPTQTARAAMTDGYSAVRRANQAWAGEIYDAVKQSAAFCALVAKPANAELFRTLRPGALAGLAGGGSGIRIDNPADERFKAYWHQEFPAQLRSLDGIVYWSPLLPVCVELGPVEICPGSHRDGLAPVVEDGGDAQKSGAYALRLADEESRLRGYGRVAPLTNPGDLILMDFLTLHQSGTNRSSHPRWSMQFRYFNFAEPTGRRIGWSGSFATGADYRGVLEQITQEQPGSVPRHASAAAAAAQRMGMPE